MVTFVTYTHHTLINGRQKALNESYLSAVRELDRAASAHGERLTRIHGAGQVGGAAVAQLA